METEECNRLFIRNLSGKEITLDARSLDTIHEVTCKIEEKWGIPGKKQSLLFKGKKLQGSLSLSQYGISNEPTLHLVTMQREGMFIYVKTLTGKTIFLEVEYKSRGSKSFDRG